jgi:RNA polymerase sigma factor (sigma-70 family)
MRNTPFDTRSSEWIGDMTVYLRETGEDNSLQLERLRRNLRRAREAELTDRQRQMLELYYDQSLTVTEISRRLGVHTSTVSRTLERARQRLRRCLRYTL